MCAHLAPPPRSAHLKSRSRGAAVRAQRRSKNTVCACMAYCSVGCNMHAEACCGAKRRACLLLEALSHQVLTLSALLHGRERVASQCRRPELRLRKQYRWHVHGRMQATRAHWNMLGCCNRLTLMALHSCSDSVPPSAPNAHEREHFASKPIGKVQCHASTQTRTKSPVGFVTLHSRREVRLRTGRSVRSMFRNGDVYNQSGGNLQLTSR